MKTDKKEKQSGLATLFDGVELKSFFINYLWFIVAVEILIFLVSFLGNLGPNKGPFPWKFYFYVSFVTPVAITFLLGVFILAFNQFIFGTAPASGEGGDADDEAVVPAVLAGVGGGPAGSSLAWALGRAGVEVVPVPQVQFHPLRPAGHPGAGQRLGCLLAPVGVDPEENRTNQVIDRINTTGAVWLGTTIECAQCHNHPFDRWTMDDYYSFAAFFSQIGRKGGEDPREKIIFNSGGGEVMVRPGDYNESLRMFPGVSVVSTDGPAVAKELMALADKYKAEAEGVTAERCVQQLLSMVPSP